MTKFLSAGLLSLFLCGCTTVYETTVNSYIEAAQKVNLGDSKNDVVLALMPSQAGLSNLDKKQPDRFKKDGKLVEVYYFRSGWQDDGITTDDEFTPYIFEDGKLVAIGWTTLGGPKTQGQAKPEVNVEHPPFHFRYHYYHY